MLYEENTPNGGMHYKYILQQHNSNKLQTLLSSDSKSRTSLNSNTLKSSYNPEKEGTPINYWFVLFVMFVIETNKRSSPTRCVGCRKTVMPRAQLNHSYFLANLIGDIFPIYLIIPQH